MACELKRLETFTNCYQVQMYLIAYSLLDILFLGERGEVLNTNDSLKRFATGR